MVNGTGSISGIRKKITTVHEMISTSYHEAGHAIYALLCYMRVPSVFIFENKKSKRIEGFCQYQMPERSKIIDPELLYMILHSEIGIKYAGLTAERYHFKTISGSDKFPIFLRDGSSDDTLSAGQIIRLYNVAPPGRKRYAFKKQMINNVLHSLQNVWSDVTLLAHALFSKKKMSFSDIKNLLLKKSQNKKFWKNQFKSICYIFENHEILDENDLKSILSS